jgi:hypothetical protein
MRRENGPCLGAFGGGLIGAARATPPARQRPTRNSADPHCPRTIRPIHAAFDVNSLIVTGAFRFDGNPSSFTDHYTGEAAESSGPKDLRLIK